MISYKNSNFLFINKLFLWAMVSVFLLLHGYMLLNKVDIWVMIVTPLVIISASCSLIPIIKKRTPYYKTTLFFSLGIFVFGIAEIVWRVLDVFFLQDPAKNILLAYLYVIPNLCFFIAVALYLWRNIKKYNIAQLHLDIAAACIMTIMVVSILFFDAQIYGPISSVMENVPGFVYLCFDAIAIMLLIVLLISERSNKLKSKVTIILIAIIIFAIANSYYVSYVIQFKYSSYSVVDWLHMASILMISVEIRLTYFRNQQEPQTTLPQLFTLNEGPIRKTWWLFLLIILIVVIHGFHINDTSYFLGVLALYNIGSLYIQKNIALERLLQERTDNNKKLEDRVMNRTKQLQSMYEELEYLSLNDKRTGLYTRDYFLDLVNETILKSNSDNMVYLILIDIDKFRMFNDQYGNIIGDSILKQIAERIKGFSDNFKHAARLDGNEFAAIYYGNDDLSDLSCQIDQLISLLREPIIVSPFNIYINVHIGIASYPKDAKNVIDLLVCSKAALEQAKFMKLKTCALYDDALYQKENRRQEIEIAMLESDVDREFELHYQPIYDIESRDLIGMEALLRWKSPSLGVVSPAEFIKIAEETGFILKIGEWVMKKAIKQVVEWNARYGCELCVGINVSSIQLQNTNFIEIVKDLILETGAKPNWINFEITETSAMDSQHLFEEALTFLSEIGVEVSIDDFGTGYSSFSYIKRFSIDYLKIDKQLIDNITIKESDEKIVLGIISMTKALDIKTIAEGVETKEQMELLERLGVDMIQGYYVGKPKTVNEFSLQYLDIIKHSTTNLTDQSGAHRINISNACFDWL